MGGLRTALAMSLAPSLLTLPGAQAADADRIRALEQQLAEQRELMAQQQRMLERLESELQALQAQPDASAPRASVLHSAGLPPADARAGDHALGLKLYGTIQLDVVHDFDRVSQDYASVLRPSTIPTVSGAYGRDGVTELSVRPSMMGLRGSADTPLGEVRGWFEFDLFGVGDDIGQTTFHLSHAWVEFGHWGFGQTNSTFMDVSVFPNTLDWWGPSGMVFTRSPQLRYVWDLGGEEFALAIEKSSGSFNTGIFGDLSPAFAEAATVRSELPDLTGHYRLERDWGHLQLAGVLRKLAFETRGTPDNRPHFEDTGWGINLTGIANSVGRDQLKFGLTYGEGIGSFLNDGGVNLAPENGRAEAVPILGGMLYYDHYWSPRWSSSVGVSFTDADVRNQQADNEFDRSLYSSVNLQYTPYPAFLVGVEALYGEHRDVAGRSGNDFRTQLTFKHQFSTQF